MARYGFSPATRVFEAAGAGACLITDAWEGIELFLEPGREILVARDGARGRGAPRARSTPRARRARSARRRARRVLAEHTYAHRARAGRSALWTARLAARGRRSPLTPSRLSTSSSSACRSPRPGATATRPPTAALVRALARARPRRAVPRARRALVRRQPRPAAARRTAAPRSTRASTSCSDRFARDGARRRSRDRRLLRARRHRGRRLGHATARAASTAFYDIDTPVTLAKLGARRLRVPRRRADPALRPLPLVHRRPDAAAARAALRLAACARPLYCSVDPDALPPGRRPSRAGTSATSAPTAPTASRRSSGCCSSRRGAGRSGRFAVAGPQYPDDDRAGRRTSSASSTCAPAEHRAFYNAQRFTLNVTRADMIAAGYSPSVRLFEAAACGAPIISDPWPGLGDLLRARRGDPDRQTRRRGAPLPARHRPRTSAAPSASAPAPGCCASTPPPTAPRSSRGTPCGCWPRAWRPDGLRRSPGM